MGFGFGLPLNWEMDVVEQNQSFEIRNLIACQCRCPRLKRANAGIAYGAKSRTCRELEASI